MRARKKTQPSELPQTDQDSPWKEVVERFFLAFMAFFLPQAFEDIDWERGYEFLDKELQKVVRDATLGRRYLDKLVKVWLKTGEEVWVLIHIEIQGYYEADFERRVYTYNYRIFDRYNREVASFIILTDDDPKWRPHEFRYERWGCCPGIVFPVVKLLDFKSRWAELEASDNPFAVVTMASLKVLETQQNHPERLAWKIALIKGLYQRGFQREDVLELLRFIDWIMILPEELALSFDDEMEKFERSKKMPYVSSFEKRWMKKGLNQGLSQGLSQGASQEAMTSVFDALETRFGTVSESLAERIQKVKDVEQLRRLLRRAIQVASPQEFELELDRSTTGVQNQAVQ